MYKMHTCTTVCTYTCIHTYIYIYIHTYTYIYIIKKKNYVSIFANELYTDLFILGTNIASPLPSVAGSGV